MRMPCCAAAPDSAKALLEGFDDLPPVPPSGAGRDQAAYEAKGLMWLQDAVAEGDPDYI